MANYRIKVERLNDEMEPIDELERGVEVDGFALLANVDEKHGMCAVQNMSILDISKVINGDKTIITAAKLSETLTHMAEGAEDE